MKNTGQGKEHTEQGTEHTKQIRGKLGKERNGIAQEIYESAGVIYFVTSASRILPVCLVGLVVM